MTGEDVGQRKLKDPGRNERQHHGGHGIAGAAQSARNGKLQADAAKCKGNDAEKMRAFLDSNRAVRNEESGQRYSEQENECAADRGNYKREHTRDQVSLLGPLQFAGPEVLSN